MKILVVGLQSARRANDVISDVKVLNEMLEPICVRMNGYFKQRRRRKKR